MYRYNKRLTLPPNSLQGVFTEHCLEHLHFGKCVKLLRELYNLLTEGSWLRVVVPDGELYCRKYVESIESGVNVMHSG